MPSTEIPQFLRKDPTERVTERKWEVLECVANGMRVSQIAEHLDINFHTVESHLEQTCAGVTAHTGVRRRVVLAPLIVQGIESGRIVVDSVPEQLKLTRRQREIKDLMLIGHRINEVANELGILPTTAELHFRNIYKKLDAKNYYHAVGKLVSYRLNKLRNLYQEPEDQVPQFLKRV